MNKEQIQADMDSITNPLELLAYCTNFFQHVEFHTALKSIHEAIGIVMEDESEFSVETLALKSEADKRMDELDKEIQAIADALRIKIPQVADNVALVLFDICLAESQK